MKHNSFAKVGGRNARGVVGITLFGCAIVIRAATITVTNATDGVVVDGQVSLREAILSVNKGSDINADVTGQRSGGYGTNDTVEFRIGAGAQTISPTSPVPAILKPVLIDGSTQPGFIDVPLITLDGANASPSANGLVIAEHEGSSLSTLNVTGFGKNGIWISAHLFADGFNLPPPADLATRPAPHPPSVAAMLQSSTRKTDAARSGGGKTAIEASSPATTLTNLVIQDSAASGVRVDGALLANNVEVASNAGDGFWIESDSPVTLAGCDIHDNARNGIRVLRDSDSAGLTLTYASTSNMIHDNGGNGIVLGDPIAQTGVINAVIRNSFITNNEIGILAQQRDPLVTPTTSSYASNSIKNNRNSGLYFKSTFFPPAMTGSLPPSPFANNIIEHNGFAVGDTSCTGQVAAQLIVEGPVSASPALAATCAAATTLGECIVNSACVFNSQSGVCSPAYPLSGDTCQTANAIAGYENAFGQSEGLNGVGIFAFDGAQVNANANFWKYTPPTPFRDFYSDASSFTAVTSSCGAVSGCSQ